MYPAISTQTRNGYMTRHDRLLIISLYEHVVDGTLSKHDAIVSFLTLCTGDHVMGQHVLETFLQNVK
jgi:hypothetical protein